MIDELLPVDTTLRLSKYLNNLIEVDRRHIRSRINVMLGFKRLRERGRYGLRHRTDASHWKRPVRSGSDAPQRYQFACCLDDGAFSSLRWRAK